MRAGLTALHRWVGLALALVLLVVALSGVLLLAKGPYYRWQYPSFGQPIAAQDRAGWPAVLEAITRRFGDEVRTAEGFFAVLASLGQTGIFRTHEVPRVKVVLDAVRGLPTEPPAPPAPPG